MRGYGTVKVQKTCICTSDLEVRKRSENTGQKSIETELYTPMTLEELMEAQEGEGIQFKEAKNWFDFGEALRCCCALSNCGGGKLVFGISDKHPRQVVGSQAFEQPERTRKGLIDKLHIMVDFQVYEHEGKRVLVFLR